MQTRVSTRSGLTGRKNAFRSVPAVDRSESGSVCLSHRPSHALPMSLTRLHSMQESVMHQGHRSRVRLR